MQTLRNQNTLLNNAWAKEDIAKEKENVSTWMEMENNTKYEALTVGSAISVIVWCISLGV